MFTKQHYQEVALECAHAFYECSTREQEAGALRVVDGLSLMFGQDNPRFDSTMFYHAFWEEVNKIKGV